MKIQVSSDLLDGLVLALLDKQDYYGYSLTQDMQRAISISESTLYPVLRRLKNNGLLETYDQSYQGRNRRYYRITDNGEVHLERIKKMWNDYKVSLDEIFEKTREGE
ncbi:PadR family transcriptional regulator [Ligilactobacillus salivarius]|uniref:PadR family transcriptional regulator n=1 Tax=Ligilactobacillus salivarius TaxID=1624 RepID=UPI00136E0F19|nr:PadR family transcriptional regulator [Ligilactobacillus salivarius]MYY53197.1 helix-turn-helix transcriptional regulator [Ligilactobacillus salivarius]